MLETIREYALERLDERDDAPLVRRQHAEHYLRLAEAAAPELERRDQVHWLDVLEADYPNIRSALAFADLRPRFARSLTFFWAYRGYLDEGRRIAEEALRDAPDDAELQFTAGLLSVMQGDYEGGRVHAEASRRIALANVHDDVLVQATNVLSRALLAAGQPELAVTLLGDALQRARAMSNDRGVAIAHLNLGYIALVHGDLARAAEALDQAIAAAATAGDGHAEARALAALASVAVESGRAAEALPHARRSLELALALGNTEMIAWPLELAGVALAASDPAGAARLLGAAEQLRVDLGLVQSGLEAEQHARVCTVLGGAHGDAWQAGRVLPLAVARELVG
jgi:tetratricopeptide (TPR) repeat protein